MNKKVIYTCLVGNYDVLRQPLAIDESYDYVCFSNDIKEDRVGVWQIRPIPFVHEDKARLSRYVKILPHRALEDYEWSLWMDANIQITDKEFYAILDSKMAGEPLPPALRLHLRGDKVCLPLRLIRVSQDRPPVLASEEERIPHPLGTVRKQHHTEEAPRPAGEESVGRMVDRIHDIHEARPVQPHVRILEEQP